MQSDHVLLELTPETMLVLEPGIHPGGVRGFVVRYKKDKKTDWGTLKKGDFRKVTLDPLEKFEVEIPTEAMTRLLQAVEERSKIAEQGIKRGNNKYIVADSEKVIVVDDASKKNIFDSLLKKGYSNEFWDLLRQSEPELATHLSVAHIYAEKVAAVHELKGRLAGTYPETKGPQSWQQWIYKHHWMFGINYIQTIEKARVTVSGSMPDYLFLTADHFADVLEIKLPSEDVVVPDTDHPGTYKWSTKSNEAICQVVAYLASINRLQSELEREIERVYGIKVSFVKPRGFVLIGDTSSWNKWQHMALRELNFHLHGVEVITYTDLLHRGSEIARMYKPEQSTPPGGKK